MAAWCELRSDFRGFRIDRVAALQVLDERFPMQPGRTLADLLRQERRRMADRAASRADVAGDAPRPLGTC